MYGFRYKNNKDGLINVDEYTKESVPAMAENQDRSNSGACNGHR